MSAERIYNLIEEQENQDGSSEEPESQSASADGASSDREDGALADDANADGDPNAPTTPGGFGQVLDAPEPEDGEGESVVEQAREWQIAVEQAENVAKLAGKLPAGITRSLESAQAAGVDWRELLRRAWSETIPADYSWMPPNRRHIWSGLYLPGIRSEGVGEIAIAVDCSGSINARLLGLFEAEIRSILAGQRPSRVHVLYFDTEVHRVETYYAGQPVTLAPVGGGGTNFAPCFEWLTEHGVCPQTPGLSHGSVRHLPERYATLSCSLGIDRNPSCSLWTGDPHGSGLGRFHPFSEETCRTNLFKCIT